MKLSSFLFVCNENNLDNDLLVKFFNACAGHVYESLYNKWFTFE